jgi:hypothetical protein
VTANNAIVGNLNKGKPSSGASHQRRKSTVVRDDDRILHFYKLLAFKCKSSNWLCSQPVTFQRMTTTWFLGCQPDKTAACLSNKCDLS